MNSDTPWFRSTRSGARGNASNVRAAAARIGGAVKRAIASTAPMHKNLSRASPLVK